MHSLVDQVIHFIYPSYCLHCGESLSRAKETLCFSCGTYLEMIDPKERCPHCFSDRFSTASGKCIDCQGKAKVFHRVASVFDYIGPAASMIKKFKYGGSAGYAPGIAAFMAAQWLELGWPKPDYLVPVPIPFTHRFRRGYNQSYLLAEELSRFLEVPHIDPLWRRSGDFSQASLPVQRRRQLVKERFCYKRRFQKETLRDKVVLLIDDVLTTGATLQCCGELLSEAFPKELYGLTVCRTTKA